MRQSGLLAAAALFALENNVQRLSDDHNLAAYLCEQLRQFENIEIAHAGANTNMVFFFLKDDDYDGLLAYGKENGVLFGGRKPVRMVTHKDVSREDIDLAISRLAGFFR